MINDFKKEGEKIVESFRQEILPLRGSRVSPALIENVLVDYWGQKTPLKQLGTISCPSFFELIIEVWDKNVITSIASALQKENYSCNVADKKIFIKLPSLTEERKKELVSKLKKTEEEYRKRLRVLRDEFNKKIEDQFKQKAIAEDEKFRLKEEIQKQTEEINKKIEQILNKKIEEIQT